MKVELFEFSETEAKQFLDADGVRELDHVKDDGYKTYGQAYSEPVKLRFYDTGKFELEITVPEELQCVPCELKFKTANKDACPCCGTSVRDIMLRNKVTEEPFRKLESMYSRLLTTTLKIAQPLCAYIADNYTEEQARDFYSKAMVEYKDLIEGLKVYNWVFEDDIIDRIKLMKEKDINVKVMKDIMTEESGEQAILDFVK